MKKLFSVLVVLLLTLSLAACGEKPEEPKEETTKICPHCYNKINIKADRCPYCTSKLNESIDNIKENLNK